MKVVFQYDASPGLAQELARLSVGGISIAPCPEGDLPRVLALMADAEALFHVLRPITAEIVAALKGQLVHAASQSVKGAAEAVGNAAKSAAGKVRGLFK